MPAAGPEPPQGSEYCSWACLASGLGALTYSDRPATPTLPGLCLKDPWGRDGPGLGTGVGCHRLTSRPPYAGSSGPRRSARWGPSGRTCPPGRPGAAAQPRALWGRRGPARHAGHNILAAVTRPRDSQEPALGGRASGLPEDCQGPGRGPVLTLAQESVLGQVPEGRLHHLKVLAAQAVHERGQESGCNAERPTHFSGNLRPVPTPDPHPTGRAEPPGSLVWPPGGSSGGLG